MNFELLPEDQDDYSDQILISWITNRYLAGDITDDNPSHENGLTGLDQVIAFNYELDPNDENERVEIECIRIDIEERIKFEMNGGFFIENQPFKICQNHPDKILLEIDRDTCIDHFGSLEEYEDWINRVSRKIFQNILTEDNPSPRNRMTGLDQFIISQVGLDLNVLEDRMAFYVIKIDLRNKETEYQGGSSIPQKDDEVLNAPVIWGELSL
jgi:hypothetical protein